ncbi:MAG: hypothetical protein ABSF44_14845 [Candidatus Bathyarchaeia archaeon]|jgi:hypothetical protein
MFKKHAKLLLVAMFIVLSLGALPSNVLAEQSGAATSISTAQSQIQSCYNAAKEADAAGANITSLTNILNNAGALLSQAELAYFTGNSNQAINLATQSQSKLDNFISQANDLKVAAIQQENQESLIVAASIAGTLAVIAAGTILWYKLKRKCEPSGAQTDES